MKAQLMCSKGEERAQGKESENWKNNRNYPI